MTQRDLAEKGLAGKGPGSWSGDNELEELVIPLLNRLPSVLSSKPPAPEQAGWPLLSPAVSCAFLQAVDHFTVEPRARSSHVIWLSLLACSSSSWERDSALNAGLGCMHQGALALPGQGSKGRASHHFWKDLRKIPS